MKHPYTVYLENVPVGMIDNDFQRMCQAFCDCSHVPAHTVMDQFIHTWKICGEGSLESIRTMYYGFYGFHIHRDTAKAYMQTLQRKGELHRIHRGWYKWTGNPTINTMPKNEAPS